MGTSDGAEIWSAADAEPGAPASTSTEAVIAASNVRLFTMRIQPTTPSAPAALAVAAAGD